MKKTKAKKVVKVKRAPRRITTSDLEKAAELYREVRETSDMFQKYLEETVDDPDAPLSAEDVDTALRFCGLEEFATYKLQQAALNHKARAKK